MADTEPRGFNWTAVMSQVGTELEKLINSIVSSVGSLLEAQSKLERTVSRIDRHLSLLDSTVKMLDRRLDAFEDQLRRLSAVVTATMADVYAHAEAERATIMKEFFERMDQEQEELGRMTRGKGRGAASTSGAEPVGPRTGNGSRGLPAPPNSYRGKGGGTEPNVRRATSLGEDPHRVVSAAPPMPTGRRRPSHQL